VTSDNWRQYDPEDLNKLMGLFQPEDINEIDGAFTSIIKDNNDGFVVEFVISVLAAKELVNEWIKACYGDAKSLNISLHEYAKIIAEIERALVEGI
jgi:hypothetical protein